MGTKQRQTGLWFKKVIALICVAALSLSMSMALPACTSSDASGNAQTSQPEATDTRTFTDSLGREVEIPTEITAIAPSGHTAQQVLLTMAPEKMVTLSTELTSTQLKYFDESLSSLPITGAAFGAKGDMNKEAVAAAEPQIIIDTGEPKDGHAEDLDALQTQMGIPVVFINTPLDDYETAYALLGDLLGMPERGKELGSYCSAVYKEIKAAMAGIPEDERVQAAYLLGDAGLNAIAQGSYQGTIIDMCANNVVVVEGVTGSGMGNEISLEQLAVWDPELIVFGTVSTEDPTQSVYSTVGDDPAWQGIAAIENDNYYRVPQEPWTWLNNPPTINQILGMQWFPRICYPEAFDDDLQEVVTEYYKLFYSYELSDADYQALTQNAQPK